MRNFWKGPGGTKEEPWFWEGNVQDSIDRFLEERGYSIVRLADPRRRERGKDGEDIEAGERDWPSLDNGQGLP